MTEIKKIETIVNKEKIPRAVQADTKGYLLPLFSLENSGPNKLVKLKIINKGCVEMPVFWL